MRDDILPSDHPMFQVEDVVGPVGDRGWKPGDLVFDIPPGSPMQGPAMPTTSELKSAMSELANELAIRGATQSHRVVIKAYQAMNHGEIEAAAGMVELAKGLVSDQLITDVLTNLFSSLGRMLGQTVEQLRSMANPVQGVSSLPASLGVKPSPNFMNWPTL